jgi:hypothetical protein
MKDILLAPFAFVWMMCATAAMGLSMLFVMTATMLAPVMAVYALLTGKFTEAILYAAVAAVGWAIAKAKERLTT